MKTAQEQARDFLKYCLTHRPTGCQLVTIGIDFDPEDPLVDVICLEQGYDLNLITDFTDQSIDLVYVHKDIPDPVDHAILWGYKIRGGGALSGWGYQDPKTKQDLLTKMGDCWTEFPDIWALPIVTV